MSRYKVVISGIHTADLKVLSNEEMKELFKKRQHEAHEVYAKMRYTCLLYTSVVGSAITRPHLTAKRFVDLLGGYQDNWREAEKAKH